MKPLTPKNDFFRTVYVEDINPTTFAPVPLTTGTITAFLSLTNDPAATTADPTLSVAAVHVGVASPATGQYPLGTWGITIPYAALTPTLLDNLFGSQGYAFLIVECAGHDRVFEKVRYLRSRPAEVVG